MAIVVRHRGVPPHLVLVILVQAPDQRACKHRFAGLRVVGLARPPHERRQAGERARRRCFSQRFDHHAPIAMMERQPSRWVDPTESDDDRQVCGHELGAAVQVRGSEAQENREGDRADSRWNHDGGRFGSNIHDAARTVSVPALGRKRNLPAAVTQVDGERCGPQVGHGKR